MKRKTLVPDELAPSAQIIRVAKHRSAAAPGDARVTPPAATTAAQAAAAADAQPNSSRRWPKAPKSSPEPAAPAGGKPPPLCVPAIEAATAATAAASALVGPPLRHTLAAAAAAAAAAPPLRHPAMHSGAPSLWQSFPALAASASQQPSPAGMSPLLPRDLLAGKRPVERTGRLFRPSAAAAGLGAWAPWSESVFERLVVELKKQRKGKQRASSEALEAAAAPLDQAAGQGVAGAPVTAKAAAAAAQKSESFPQGTVPQVPQHAPLATTAAGPHQPDAERTAARAPTDATAPVVAGASGKGVTQGGHNGLKQGLTPAPRPAMEDGQWELQTVNMDGKPLTELGMWLRRLLAKAARERCPATREPGFLPGGGFTVAMHANLPKQPEESRGHEQVRPQLHHASQHLTGPQSPSHQALQQQSPEANATAGGGVVDVDWDEAAGRGGLSGSDFEPQLGRRPPPTPMGPPSSEQAVREDDYFRSEQQQSHQPQGGHEEVTIMREAAGAAGLQMPSQMQKHHQQQKSALQFPCEEVDAAAWLGQPGDSVQQQEGVTNLLQILRALYRRAIMQLKPVLIRLKGPSVGGNEPELFEEAVLFFMPLDWASAATRAHARELTEPAGPVPSQQQQRSFRAKVAGAPGCEGVGNGCGGGGLPVASVDDGIGSLDSDRRGAGGRLVVRHRQELLRLVEMGLLCDVSDCVVADAPLHAPLILARLKEPQGACRLVLCTPDEAMMRCGFTSEFARFWRMDLLLQLSNGLVCSYASHYCLEHSTKRQQQQQPVPDGRRTPLPAAASPVRARLPGLPVLDVRLAGLLADVDRLFEEAKAASKARIGALVRPNTAVSSAVAERTRARTRPDHAGSSREEGQGRQEEEEDAGEYRPAKRQCRSGSAAARGGGCGGSTGRKTSQRRRHTSCMGSGAAPSRAHIAPAACLGAAVAMVAQSPPPRVSSSRPLVHAVDMRPGWKLKPINKQVNSAPYTHNLVAALSSLGGLSVEGPEREELVRVAEEGVRPAWEAVLPPELRVSEAVRQLRRLDPAAADLLEPLLLLLTPFMADADNAPMLVVKPFRSGEDSRSRLGLLFCLRNTHFLAPTATQADNRCDLYVLHLDRGGGNSQPQPMSPAFSSGGGGYGRRRFSNLVERRAGAGGAADAAAGPSAGGAGTAAWRCRLQQPHEWAGCTWVDVVEVAHHEGRSGKWPGDLTLQMGLGGLHWTTFATWHSSNGMSPKDWEVPAHLHLGKVGFREYPGWMEIEPLLDPPAEALAEGPPVAPGQEVEAACPAVSDEEGYDPADMTQRHPPQLPVDGAGLLAPHPAAAVGGGVLSRLLQLLVRLSAGLRAARDEEMMLELYSGALRTGGYHLHGNNGPLLVRLPKDGRYGLAVCPKQEHFGAKAANRSGGTHTRVLYVTTVEAAGVGVINGRRGGHDDQEEATSRCDLQCMALLPQKWICVVAKQMGGTVPAKSTWRKEIQVLRLRPEPGSGAAAAGVSQANVANWQPCDTDWVSFQAWEASHLGLLPTERAGPTDTAPPAGQTTAARTTGRGAPADTAAVGAAAGALPVLQQQHGGQQLQQPPAAGSSALAAVMESLRPLAPALAEQGPQVLRQKHAQMYGLNAPVAMRVCSSLQGKAPVYGIGFCPEGVSYKDGGRTGVRVLNAPQVDHTAAANGGSGQLAAAEALAVLKPRHFAGMAPGRVRGDLDQWKAVVQVMVGQQPEQPTSKRGRRPRAGSFEDGSTWVTFKKWVQDLAGA